MPHRSRLQLDGQWQLWTDPDSALAQNSLTTSERTPMLVDVPAPWQSQAPELRYYSGPVWYQRKFDLPVGWLEDKAIILGINAADYSTKVWLNGVEIGEHEGGYLPFELAITHAARPGENTLTVRVDDSAQRFTEIPHGKQSWYGQISGIWQSVWVESRSPLHVQTLHVFPELETGCIRATFSLVNASDAPGQFGGCRAISRVITPDGSIVSFSEAQISTKSRSQNVTFQVANPLPWSPDRPNMYRLEIELFDGETSLDRISKSFGFRTITARDGKLYLNGELLYLRGALDQDYYPETITTPPSEAFLEDQIHKAKELGLNCLRCHIKVADPRYYEVADRLGILVWTELPNWSTFTEQSGRLARETLEGILARDGHHPAIIIWTIINENWGMDLVNNPAHRKWLKETFHWLKALDPSRLVVDNSACKPNFHLQTDIEDFHFYRGIPDHRREWDRFVRTFAGRVPWTFCPNGDSARSFQEPLIVSEFGNWGLPDVDLLVDEQGRDPWWLETGLDWGEGVAYPQGVRNRFYNLGLDHVFGSWKGFVAASQRQQCQALKYQIETIRKYPEISGYVITELTDVHWESNGLLDLKRNRKIFHDEFHDFNADTVILPEWDRLAYWSGEQARISLAVARGSGAPLTGVELHWWLEGDEPGFEDLHGVIRQPGGDPIQPGALAYVGEAAVRMPSVAFPRMIRAIFELRARGKVLARNHLEIALFPFRDHSCARLFTTDLNLAGRLAFLGYELTGEMESADAVLTNKVDFALLDYLRSGGHALVLADRDGASVQGLHGIRLVDRAGTPWSGDWASSFSWLNRKKPFDRLPGGPLIDHAFDRVIPERVLTGFKEWDFQSLVPAGMFVGWIHKPAAIVGQRYYGQGKAVLNTFNLSESDLGRDPTATNLLDALIELTTKESHPHEKAIRLPRINSDSH